MQSCTNPKSGLLPEMGKMAEKWILAPPRKGGKMGKLAQKWVKNGHFPIFRSFFPPFFRGGAKIQFSAISDRRPNLGSVQGNQDRSTKQNRGTRSRGDTLGDLGAEGSKHPSDKSTMSPEMITQIVRKHFFCVTDVRAIGKLIPDN